MRRIDLSGVEGERWVPETLSGVGALVLAGSSGRIDSARAELLARQGVIAESIRWFGGPGQHVGPWEIPLELFIGRIAELKRDCDRVLVLGTSFGAEAALLTGCHTSEVDAVVGFAPSDVAWAASGRTARRPRIGRSAAHRFRLSPWTRIGCQATTYRPSSASMRPVGSGPPSLWLRPPSPSKTSKKWCLSLVATTRCGPPSLWPPRSNLGGPRMASPPRSCQTQMPVIARFSPANPP